VVAERIFVAVAFGLKGSKRRQIFTVAVQTTLTVLQRVM
jgi:hypothetical protein